MLALILQNLFEAAEDNRGPVQVLLCKQIGKIIENYFLHVDLAEYTSKILKQRDKLLWDRNAHLTLRFIGEKLNIEVPLSPKTTSSFLKLETDDDKTSCAASSKFPSCFGTPIKKTESPNRNYQRMDTIISKSNMEVDKTDGGLMIYP